MKDVYIPVVNYVNHHCLQNRLTCISQNYKWFYHLNYDSFCDKSFHFYFCGKKKNTTIKFSNPHGMPFIAFSLHCLLLALLAPRTSPKYLPSELLLVQYCAKLCNVVQCNVTDLTYCNISRPPRHYNTSDLCIIRKKRSAEKASGPAVIVFRPRSQF